MVSTVRTCAKCGEGIPADVLAGLCPKCVARLTLRTVTGEDSASRTDHLSPVPHPLVRYFGDYELLEEIGRGGMGVVYKARQVSLGRMVAVKMLLHGGFASEEFVKRFQAEAQAAASLQHANIVAIHEVGVHEGLQYFSMDYVEGPSLAELARNQPLPGVRAARYVQLIAQAIHYAHQRGILHRDLKPSNVVVDPLDQPRITDFGLAKRMTAAALDSSSDPQLTLTGQVLGAPSYMPPEQAAGKRGQVGVQSDVYALGAVLYHLLTGRPPFVGETLQETLLQVQNQEPAKPRQLNSDVSRDLECICLKCLRKNPQDRYESAAALAEDLRRWQAGEPILAQPLGVGAELWRRCRRWSTVAVVLGVLVLALALVLLLAPGAADRKARVSGSLAPGVNSASLLTQPKAARASSALKSPASEPALELSSAGPRVISWNREITWSRGPDLPEAYEETRAIVLEGILYVVGGRSGHGEPHACVSTVQVYDPDTDRWSYGTPLPEPLAAVGLAECNGFLYCFGGIREAYWWGHPVASAYRFDLRNGQWERLAEMPIERSNFAIGVLGERIHCAGGNIYWPDATSRIDSYDPGLNQWVDVGVMPTPRGGCSGGPWRGRLMIGPGLPNAKLSPDQNLFVYDPEKHQTSEPAAAQEEMNWEAGLLFTDESGIYVLGRTNQGLSPLWICRLAVETGKADFFAPPSPMSRACAAAAYDSARGTAYVVGGSAEGSVSKTFEKARVVSTKGPLR